MGLTLSLMMYEYITCKEKSIEMIKIRRSGYIELSSINLDKNDKQIIFNNNING